MDKADGAFEPLKDILRHAREPGRLDGHPWTRSLFVRAAVRSDPGLQEDGPGAQLVGALAGLFRALQPANPPRRGLRLDPRWGEFGLLAALYFAPFNHGRPFPRTQMEAWERIDPAILYFVYGAPPETLGAEQAGRYRLVGDELEFASPSTLSDWHRKGLQRLAEAVLSRERYLARQSGEPSCLLEAELQPGVSRQRPAPPATPSYKAGFSLKRGVLLAVACGLLLALGLAGLKGWRVYQRGRQVYEQATRIRALVQAPLDLEDLEAAGPLLVALQDDWVAFRDETRPLLWLGPALDWLPEYGADLANAPALAELGDDLLQAAVSGYSAGRPLLQGLDAQDGRLDAPALVGLLLDAQPELSRAQARLQHGIAVRASIRAEGLSPRLQALLAELDPLLGLADDGLSLALAAPSALGGSGEGPKTYLLLAQNEDELRPTGGFITSVGNLVVHKGRIISLSFEAVDSGVQEDWSKPYPAAPWQLQDYMNSGVLILRDSNWFSDYPTSAQWAEFLYAYKHAHSVDGVIAFDQRFLVMLLAELGPLQVEGAPYPLTSENVLAYMRAAKEPPPGQVRPPDWYRKEFIAEISQALLVKVTLGEGIDWRALAGVLARAVAERHLLLQFDDPRLTGLLAERGWDNALRAGAGDFLMVTDTNIGFNKTSAIVEVSLAYDVDLSEPSAPRAGLLTSHRNKAGPDVPCLQWDTENILPHEAYPTNRCYWDYLRVYKQAGAALLEARPHAIPGEQLILGEDVPARVDELEEELPGVRGYGTLLVVPGDQSWNTGFTFSLPVEVLAEAGEPGAWRYRLQVHKQPGTLAIPLTVRVHLPARTELLSSSLPGTWQGDNLLIKTDLRTDVTLEVVFRLP